MTTFTDKTALAEIRAAWSKEVRATRAAVLPLCERGFTPRITQIEVIACNARGRVSGGELAYVEGPADITAESIRKWAAQAREIGATYFSLEGRWDLVNKSDEDDYDLTDTYVSVDLHLA